LMGCDELPLLTTCEGLGVFFFKKLMKPPCGSECDPLSKKKVYTDKSTKKSTAQILLDDKIELYITVMWGRHYQRRGRAQADGR